MTIDESDLLDVLINPKKNRTGQYICDCPFCNKERHFYISVKTQLWDCKKCGESGNIYKLLSHLNKLYLVVGSTIQYKEKIQSIIDVSDDVSDIAVPDMKTVTMPAGWKVVQSDDYLIGRRITNKQCEKYQIGRTNLLRKYKDYILIPIYQDGEIKGFFGRYAAAKVPKGVPKYNNSKGVNFAALLGGYDEIIRGEIYTVVLVEGVFDKIKVDTALRLHGKDFIKCCYTFGKKISDIQIQRLVEKGVCNVILLYDFDAVREMKSYSTELDKWFTVSVTYTNKKDIDECTDQEAWEVLQKAVPSKEFRFSTIEMI